MALISRPATDADVDEVLEITNSNLLALNPREKRIGEIEAREFIRGFFDPAITRLTRLENSEVWQSFVTLNPDSSRKRFYLDIYTRPGAPTLESSLELAIETARKNNSDYQLWIGAQSNDFAYQKLLEVRGFGLLRRYWTLEMTLSESSILQPESTGSIRLANLDDQQDLRLFYQVHQDSFSRHFGFMPRDFEKWSELVLRDRDESNMIVWFLTVDGTVVGFIDCNDELIHEDAGYISGLGVRLDQHGKGFGEALLRHAIKTYSRLGRQRLCLSVDAGNESGALRLYEKVGMKPISEWHHYQNLNWSKV